MEDSGSDLPPTPPPNPLLELVNKYDGDSEDEIDAPPSSPLPRQTHPLNLPDDIDDLNNDDVRSNNGARDDFPSTMPAEVRAPSDSPAGLPRFATQPEPLMRARKAKKSKRRSSVDANLNTEATEDAGFVAEQLESPDQAKRKRSKSKRKLHERPDVTIEDEIDHPFERSQDRAQLEDPGAEAEGGVSDDVFGLQDQPLGRKKKKGGHAKLSRHLDEDADTQPFSTDVQTLSQQGPDHTPSDGPQQASQELPTLGSFDTESARRKMRKERRKERRRARGLVSLLPENPIGDNEVIDIPVEPESSPKKHKGGVDKGKRRAREMESQLADRPSSDNEMDAIPGHMRTFTVQGSRAKSGGDTHRNDDDSPSSKADEGLPVSGDSGLQTAQPDSTSEARAASRPPKAKRRKQPKTRTVPENGMDHEDEVEDEKDSKLGIKSRYQTGTLTLVERNQVCSAVETIRKNAGLSDSEMVEIIHANPREFKDSIHHQLWNAVVEACPTRPRRKLIEWCRQQFHNFVARGTWTEEQDEELERMIRIHGTKWSVIGGLIRRHQKDVRDRYRNYLVCRGAAKSRYWSPEEENKFFEVVEKAVDNIRKGLALDDSADKSIEDLINWHQISEGMGFQRTRLQCLEKWNRMRASDALPNRITVKLPQGQSSRLSKARKDLQRMTGQEKYSLACGVKDSGARDEPEVPWQDIMTERFGDKFQRQTLVVAWGRLRESVPDWQSQTTAECAQYIVDMYEEDDAFLADDRTVASRSRASTVDIKTPSKRNAVKRRGTTPRQGSQRVALSKRRVNPDDDLTSDEGEQQLSALGILSSGRVKSRAAFEEVDESDVGGEPNKPGSDVEMADGDESGGDNRGECETTVTTTNGVRHGLRAASVDLGVDSDPALGVKAESEFPSKKKKRHKVVSPKKPKSERAGKEKARPVDEEENATPDSPDPPTTARKRRAVETIAEPTPTGGTNQAATPGTGESPTKKRRRDLRPKVYSSVKSLEKKARLLGRSSLNGHTALGRGVDDDDGDLDDDDELEVSSPWARSRPQSSATKRVRKKTPKDKTPSTAIGSPSVRHSQAQQSQQSELPPPSSQPRPADDHYTGQSSDADSTSSIPDNKEE